jgi:GTP-binding protein
MVDATSEDPIEAYNVVRAELDAYGAGLEDKDEIIALSKSDAVEPKALAKLQKKLAKLTGREVLTMSSASRQGVDTVLDRLIEVVGRASELAPGEKAKAWTPV